jgi:ubiquinone/menaquinone biosynthesis C-methylase UbiE
MITSEMPSEDVQVTDLAMREAIMSGWYQEDTNELFKGIPIGSEDIVVDVGCGHARNLLFCAKRGAHVVAVDRDQNVIHELEQDLSPYAPERSQVIHADAHQLPLASDYATRVICTEVLEHVDDPEAMLAELTRIGKPGSLYLLSVPGELQEGMQKLVAPPSYFEAPNHIRVIEREKFIELVKSAGLEVLEVTQYGFFWTIWMAFWWATDTPLHEADHPAINYWTKAWEAVLDTPFGWHFKAQLDRFMPKSVVIIARKPS